MRMHLSQAEAAAASCGAPQQPTARRIFNPGTASANALARFTPDPANAEDVMGACGNTNPGPSPPAKLMPGAASSEGWGSTCGEGGSMPGVIASVLPHCPAPPTPRSGYAGDSLSSSGRCALANQIMAGSSPTAAPAAARGLGVAPQVAHSAPGQHRAQVPAAASNGVSANAPNPCLDSEVPRWRMAAGAGESLASTAAPRGSATTVAATATAAASTQGVPSPFVSPSSSSDAGLRCTATAHEADDAGAGGTGETAPAPRPSLLAGWPLVAHDTRGFLNPGYSCDSSDWNSENSGAGVRRAGSANSGPAPSCATAPVAAPERPPAMALFPLTTAEDAAVRRAYGDFAAQVERRRIDASSAAALVTDDLCLLNLLRVLHERAQAMVVIAPSATRRAPDEGVTAAAVEPPSRETLLGTAEACFGTRRFRTLLHATTTTTATAAQEGGGGAGSNRLTIAEALAYLGYLKFESAADVFTRGAKTPTASAVAVAARQAPAPPAVPSAATAADTAPDPAAPPAGRSESPADAGVCAIPHAPAAGILTTLAVSPSPPPPPLTLSGGTHHGARRPSRPPPSPLARAPVNTAAPLTPPPPPSAPPPPTSRVTARKAHERRRRGSRGAPLPPPSPCASSNDSARLEAPYRDDLIRTYVERKAFAELAEAGNARENATVPLGRLVDVLRCFELALNPSAVERVCGVQMRAAGKPQDAAIDFSAFVRIINSALHCQVNSEASCSSTARGSASVDNTDDARSDMMMLVLPADGTGRGGTALTPISVVAESTTQASALAAGSTAYSSRSAPGLGAQTVSYVSSGRDSEGSERSNATTAPATAAPSHRRVSSLGSTTATLTAVTAVGSAGSMPRFAVDTDDAYPVVIARDSATAALCRGIRQRLRRELRRSVSSASDVLLPLRRSRSGGDGDAVVEAEVVVVGEVPPLPPPPAPPTTATQRLSQPSLAPQPLRAAHLVAAVASLPPSSPPTPAPPASNGSTTKASAAAGDRDGERGSGHTSHPSLLQEHDHGQVRRRVARDVPAPSPSPPSRHLAQHAAYSLNYKMQAFREWQQEQVAGAPPSPQALSPRPPPPHPYAPTARPARRGLSGRGAGRGAGVDPSALLSLPTASQQGCRVEARHGAAAAAAQAPQHRRVPCSRPAVEYGIRARELQRRLPPQRCSSSGRLLMMLSPYFAHGCVEIEQRVANPRARGVVVARMRSSRRPSSVHSQSGSTSALFTLSAALQESRAVLFAAHATAPPRPQRRMRPPRAARRNEAASAPAAPSPPVPRKQPRPPAHRTVPPSSVSLRPTRPPAREVRADAAVAAASPRGTARCASRGGTVDALRACDSAAASTFALHSPPVPSYKATDYTVTTASTSTATATTAPLTQCSWVSHHAWVMAELRELYAQHRGVSQRLEVLCASRGVASGPEWPPPAPAIHQAERREAMVCEALLKDISAQIHGCLGELAADDELLSGDVLAPAPQPAMSLFQPSAAHTNNGLRAVAVQAPRKSGVALGGSALISQSTLTPLTPVGGIASNRTCSAPDRVAPGQVAVPAPGHFAAAPIIVPRPPSVTVQQQQQQQQHQLSNVASLRLPASGGWREASDADERHSDDGAAAFATLSHSTSSRSRHELSTWTARPAESVHSRVTATGAAGVQGEHGPLSSCFDHLAVASASANVSSATGGLRGTLSAAGGGTAATASVPAEAHAPIWHASSPRGATAAPRTPCNLVHLLPLQNSVGQPCLSFAEGPLTTTCTTEEDAAPLGLLAVSLRAPSSVATSSQSTTPPSFSPPSPCDAVQRAGHAPATPPPPLPLVTRPRRRPRRLLAGCAGSSPRRERPSSGSCTTTTAQPQRRTSTSSGP